MIVKSIVPCYALHVPQNAAEARFDPFLPHCLTNQFKIVQVGNDQTAQQFTPKHKKVQVGKDQEKAQSEKDSHSKNRGGKKPN